ncbi:MAG: DEAD/DEAH box helicase [Lactobacillales bacterium]|jgi:superfamily II DNA/RNA helicase|nr:DEAD/DEAH box helicase [Lactobacillales bacterium]
MTSFKELGIPSAIMDSLTKMNFTTPTPIQEKSIPVALQGHDVLGSAQTGTGKTAAFAIPMINHLMQNETNAALILLPTRELADQVLEATNKILGKLAHIKTVLLIGGNSMSLQLQKLQKKPRLIVGTPGRINDHLRRKSLDLSATNFLVLDETDRMLDMGFGAQLNEIAKYLPKQRQTLMFSATLPKNIVSLSHKYLNNPVRIAVGADNETAANVRQKNVNTTDQNKYAELIYQINASVGSILVFVRTKHGAARMAVKLTKAGLSADAIHGDLKQKRRQRVITDFRGKAFRILVATDIAARGLDISHIENVINYDLPQVPEDYIHRVGRTGRADATGIAINLLAPADAKKWKEIQKLLKLKKEDIRFTESSPAPQEKAPARPSVLPEKKKEEKPPFTKFSKGKKFKNRKKFNQGQKPFKRKASFSKRRPK